MKRSVKTLENVIADDTFNIADYPACIAFWDCLPTRVEESPGTGLDSGSITDLVTGNKTLINNTLAVIHQADGGILLPESATAYGTHSAGSGDLPVLSNTKHQVLITVADFGGDSQDGFSLGSVGAAEERLSVTHTIGGTVYDGTNSILVGLGLAIDNNTQAVAAYINWTDSEFTIFETDGVAATSKEVQSGADFDITDSIDLSANDNCLVIKNSTTSGVDLVFYGKVLFEFTAQPSDVDINAAMSWCNYQWRNGNQGILPPQWKNRS